MLLPRSRRRSSRPRWVDQEHPSYFTPFPSSPDSLRSPISSPHGTSHLSPLVHQPIHTHPLPVTGTRLTQTTHLSTIYPSWVPIHPITHLSTKPQQHEHSAELWNFHHQSRMKTVSVHADHFSCEMMANRATSFLLSWCFFHLAKHFFSICSLLLVALADLPQGQRFMSYSRQ